MQAKKVVVTRNGGPEVINIVNYEVAQPKPNEVRIAVAYAGVAYADVILRRMRFPGLPKPPFTPGADFSGIVDEVGSAVRGLKKGDRVAALLMSVLGGQAQYVCVEADRVTKLPPEIALDKAACLPVNYLTAHQMLFDNAKVRAGDTILIHGGSGGVGTALIQLVAAHGILPIATASAKKRSVVESLGARFIDYRNDDFVEIVRQWHAAGIDAVFDHIGGPHIQRSQATLKPGGRLVAYGMHGSVDRGPVAILGQLFSFVLRRQFTRRQQLMYYQLRDKHPSVYTTQLQQLFELHRQKKIDPVIGNTFPLQRAAEASALLEKGGSGGKILLTLSDR